MPKDASAESFNLGIKIAGMLVLYGKIELDLVPIDVTVQVHHEGFRAAPIHPAENMQNPFRGSHTALRAAQ
jgi:hypothetical protein